MLWLRFELELLIHSPDKSEFPTKQLDGKKTRTSHSFTRKNEFPTKQLDKKNSNFSFIHSKKVNFQPNN